MGRVGVRVRNRIRGDGYLIFNKVFVILLVPQPDQVPSLDTAVYTYSHAKAV